MLLRSCRTPRLFTLTTLYSLYRAAVTSEKMKSDLLLSSSSCSSWLPCSSEREPGCAPCCRGASAKTLAAITTVRCPRESALSSATAHLAGGGAVRRGGGRLSLTVSRSVSPTHPTHTLSLTSASHRPPAPASPPPSQPRPCPYPRASASPPLPPPLRPPLPPPLPLPLGRFWEGSG